MIFHYDSCILDSYITAAIISFSNSKFTVSQTIQILINFRIFYIYHSNVPIYKSYETRVSKKSF